MTNKHDVGQGRRVEATEFDHNHACEDTCDVLISIMCQRCPVRHVCHFGGNVNHRQANLCANMVLQIETEKRPKTVEEIVYREDIEKEPKKKGWVNYH